MINIKYFVSNLLKIDKKSYKNIDIYYIGYITIKKNWLCKYDYVNPLYLIIDKVYGYIEEKNRNKYLILASTDKIKRYWQNTQNFGMGLKIWLKK